MTRHLYPVTHYGSAEPSPRALEDVEDIESRLHDQIEGLLYLGRDEEAEALLKQLDDLDALRAQEAGRTRDGPVYQLFDEEAWIAKHKRKTL